MRLEFAALILGAFLVGIAVAWRTVASARATRQLRTALHDADPRTRSAAIFTVASRGLSRHAALLLDRLKTETDPDVLDAAVEAVARGEWEPSDNRRIVELRLWARHRLSAPPPADHVHRAEPDEPTPETPDEPIPDEAGSVAPPSLFLVKGRRSDPEHSVLVTGAGGPAGVAVINALQSDDHHVVAVDADRLAAGLRIADSYAVCPPYSDPAIVDALIDIAVAHRANAIISTMAEEMLVLSEHQDAFRANGIDIWLPSRDAIETCIDKWKFASVTMRAEIETPMTNLESARGVPGPWIVKPRFGRGSRDVFLADNHAELEIAIRRCPEPIVQTRVEGHEFTVDALVDRRGFLVCAVPRWRLETKAGISTKGRTFVDDWLLEALVPVLSAVGLRGSANIQGFIKEDGEPCFIEVNPRFSGGLPLSLAAGADLVGEYLRCVRGERTRPERLGWRADVTMIRHFAEVFEG